MADDRPDLKSVWSTQETEAFSMSLDEIRARSNTLQRKVRSRNLREYAASVFVIAIFGAYAVFLPGTVLKIGCALIIAGTMFVVWQLHRRASAQSPPLVDSVMEHLAFHRAALVRQRDALKTVAVWYLAPFLPGLIVFMYGVYSQVPITRVKLLGPPLSAAIVTLVFILVWWLNRFAAGRLQKQIDALDRAGTH